MSSFKAKVTIRHLSFSRNLIRSFSPFPTNIYFFVNVSCIFKSILFYLIFFPISLTVRIYLTTLASLAYSVKSSYVERPSENTFISPLFFSRYRFSLGLTRLLIDFTFYRKEATLKLYQPSSASFHLTPNLPPAFYSHYDVSCVHWYSLPCALCSLFLYYWSLNWRFCSKTILFTINTRAITLAFQISFDYSVALIHTNSLTGISILTHKHI